MPEASRLHDPIEHSSALAGFLVGAVLGIAAGALIVATGGAAGIIAAAVIGSSMAAGAGIGEVIGSLSCFNTVTGGVATGSPNTYTNDRASTRATLDIVLCSHGHDGKRVAQGSGTVFINDQPASRKGDKIECAGKLVECSGDVFIGGPTVTTLDIASEVPKWLRWTVMGIGILSSIVLVGPLMTAIGIGASMAGGAAGVWVAEQMGLGEDGQKLMGLAGSMLFGTVAGRYGRPVADRVAYTMVPRVGMQRAAFLAEGVPGFRNPSRFNMRYVRDVEVPRMDFRPDNGRPGALWTGPGAKDAAQNGGYATLESNTPGGRALVAYDKQFEATVPWSERVTMWDAGSARYARTIGANNPGNAVPAFRSSAANPTSVYYRVEQPTLKGMGITPTEIPVTAPPRGPGGGPYPAPPTVFNPPPIPPIPFVPGMGG